MTSEKLKGSRFTVVLPRADSASVAEQPTAAPSVNATVLLVEDEEQIRNVTARILRRAGYAVLEARDGEEALEMSKAFGSELHVLLSDAVMPRLGGLVLARMLRESRPHIKVLLMSGYSSGMVDAPADQEWSFLPKPFGPKALLSALASTLGDASNGMRRSDDAR